MKSSSERLSDLLLARDIHKTKPYRRNKNKEMENTCMQLTTEPTPIRGKNNRYIGKLTNL